MSLQFLHNPTAWVYASLRKQASRCGFHRPLSATILTGDHTYQVTCRGQIVWSGYAMNAADAKSAALNLIITHNQRA